jgi:chloramphenicol O-acetyltransferase type B
MTFVRRLFRPLRQRLLPNDVDRFNEVRARGRVDYGIGTYGAPKILEYAYDDSRLTVGSYTSIAANVTIMLGGNHPMDRVTTLPIRILWDLPGAGDDGYPSTKGDTRVGSDVWIGHEALILSGVTIGDGAVIAARAVVTKDVEPYAIVAGNPARVISFRHTPEQRDALRAIAWWNWPEAQILAAADRLSASDIDGFIRWARECR